MVDSNSLGCSPFNCVLINYVNADSEIKIDGLSGQSLNLEIQGFTNSYSTKPVGPINVGVYDSNDRLL